MIDTQIRTAMVHTLASVRPQTAEQLHGWLRAVLGIDVPRATTCDGHAGPMDYLAHVFFEQPGDVIVWANRGGGKTYYGAVATLLDLLFKPGIEVRILGGSFEQSRKMHEYLRWMLERDGLRHHVAGRITDRGVRLTNGSKVELLVQSETSVRGHRVQKLRCDEIELFDRDVWQAAQFVTRSARCGDIDVCGAVEVFSTMHRPFGLMNELIAQAPAVDAAVFKWCALDVIARCEPTRACDDCPLWDACRGRAKQADGFISVQDVIDQHRRSSRQAFEAEMLSRRPTRTDAVFSSFDPAVHVSAIAPDPQLHWVGGMDFGIRSPFVMLWAQITPGPPGDPPHVDIIDEYVMSDLPVNEHLETIAQRGWPTVDWLGVDPAGAQRNEQTGRSTLSVLRDAGHTVRATRRRLADGIELLRRMLEVRDSTPGGDAADTPDDAPPRPPLLIHPRCERLIEAMTCYHFDADRPHRDEPIKDGHDHPVDALRYLVTNLYRGSGKVRRRVY
ncbi:MAG: hypothetical protein CMJ49_08210 [Planctomycetaceae bacterium]|nr:hypothetical protein [Planctomycetaceae bacterium]